MKVGDFGFEIKEYGEYKKEKGWTLVEYTGEDTRVVVPATVGDELNAPVVAIGTAFTSNSRIEEVIFPDSVVSVERHAFYECKSLREIRFPAKVTYLGTHSFFLCSSLETVVFSDELRKIPECAFAHCTNLSTIVFGEGITDIGSCTFIFCHSITHLSLPKGLTHLGSRAFGGCHNLKEVIFQKEIASLGKNVFEKCENLEKISFLQKSDMKREKYSTGDSSFSYTIKMRERFFEYKEELPREVISRFSSEDKELYEMDQLSVWEYLSSRGKKPFLKSWKKKITYATKKGENLLRNLVFFKGTVKEMSLYFEEGFHLEYPELEIYVAHSIENGNTKETALLLEYKNKQFSKEFLEEYQRNVEVVALGFELPSMAQLQEKWEVVERKHYISIQGYLGTSRHEVLPEAIDTGKPITIIKAQKEGSFDPLETLVFSKNLKSVHDTSFQNSSFVEMDIPQKFTKISERMFQNCQKLKKISIHSGVTEIQTGAFRFCFALEEVQLPENLEKIGDSVFEYCTSLKEIVLPDSLSFLGKHSFARLIHLKTITIPSKVTRLQEKTFQHCCLLKEVYLSNAEIDIDPMTFHDCENLEFIGVKGGENLMERYRQSVGDTMK